MMLGLTGCNKAVGGCFKYALLNNAGYEQQHCYANQFSRNYLRRGDNHCSNCDWPANNGLAFFIGYIKRPQLKPYFIPIEENQVGQDRRLILLLGIRNDGKNTARKCNATFESNFSVYKELEGKYPQFGNLSWVLPDGTETHEIDIPYKRPQPLLLTRLTLRISEEEYSLYRGDSFLFGFGRKTKPEPSQEGKLRISAMAVSFDLNVSVYGEGGLQQSASVSVTFSSTGDVRLELLDC